VIGQLRGSDATKLPCRLRATLVWVKEDIRMVSLRVGRGDGRVVVIVSWRVWRSLRGSGWVSCFGGVSRGLGRQSGCLRDGVPRLRLTAADPPGTRVATDWRLSHGGQPRLSFGEIPEANHIIDVSELKT
jgi:hypothetical protein